MVRGTPHGLSGNAWLTIHPALPIKR